MVYAVLILGGLGILFGFGLFVASRVFHVKEDPRVEKVENTLPGANCGACGRPGCRALAEAVVHGSAPPSACPVCGAQEKEIIAGMMGLEVETGTRKVAVLHCQGRNVEDRFAYQGPESCRASELLIGGHKACPYGCLGFGDCVRACPFGTLTMVDGIPEVNEEKCTACGKCVEACPRNLFELHAVDMHVHVRCRSSDKGGAVRKYCEVGCIACKKCEKACKFDAIHVKDFLAQIDYGKCTNCAACVKVCPNSTIVNYRKARMSRAKREAS